MENNETMIDVNDENLETSGVILIDEPPIERRLRLSREAMEDSKAE
jgi:hypothetical protein